MRLRRVLFMLAGAFSALYYVLLRRPILTWGATDAEVESRLPGDELLESADGVTTRAIGIQAPASDVWPWLAQMGPSPRGGAYTYDWIENLLGLNMHSVDRVLPEFQHPEVGDTIGLGPNRMRVERVEPKRVLAWRSEDGNWVWAFVLEEKQGRTRLISRNRFRLPTLASRIGMLPMEPGSLVMERRDAARDPAARGAARIRTTRSSLSLLVLPARDHEPGLPAGRASPWRRLNRLGVDAAARDHPGDHRVRVPHLARPELIATPNRSRDLRDQLEHAPRAIFVVAQSPRAVDGLGDVRDVAAAPKADLVAEDPKSARPATADRAFGDDAPLLAAPVVDRRLLDDERPLRDLDLERGVVEVTRRTPLQSVPPAPRRRDR